MKTLISLFLVTWLSGCTLIDAYFMTKYDANEYLLISKIRVDAEQFKKECSNLDISHSNSKTLLDQTKLFVAYSQYVPRNKNVITASTELNAMAQGLYDQYQKNQKVSPAFCNIKFESLEKSAEKIQSIIGGRPR